MLAALVSASRVDGQTIWDAGGANDNWSTAANWNNNIAPSNPSGSVLQFTGKQGTSPVVDTPWTVNGIQFLNGANAFTISGSAITIATSSGVVNSDNSTQTINTAIALGATATIDTAAQSIVLGGAISGTGFGLTKTGIGGTATLTLSGTAANTYTGTTTINAGTLTLAKTAGVTAVAGNITIGDGAGTDTLRTNTANQIASNSAITFTAGGTPTFNLNSQAQTVGSIASSNTAAAITLLSATLTVGGDNTSTTFAGAISGTGGLTKVGTGALTLTNATSSFTGQVHVQEGAISINALANGGTASPLGDNATIKLGSAGSTGTLQYTGPAVTVNRGIDLAGTTGGGILDTTGGTGALTLSGAISASGAGSKTLTLTGTSTHANTLSGAIGDNSALNPTAVVKSGSGNWTLSGSSSYTGGTTVTGGTLTAQGSSPLGGATGATTVSAGATLALGGTTTITKSSTLSLAGTGAASATGALHGAAASGQTAQWSGNIALAGNATITSGSGLLILGEGSAFTHTLNLGASTLTFDTTNAATTTPTYLPFPTYLLDPSNILVNSAISGTGGIVKTGTGTLNLMPVATGGSTFTGSTVVTGGKLILDSQTNSPAIASTQIYVGNASTPGAADSVVLQIGQLASTPAANNMVGIWNPTTNASSSNLTIYSDGLFNMNNASNGFASLTLQGGHVSGGSLAYNPLLTITGGVTSLASSRTALIEQGNFGMSANNFAFNVATGSTPTGVDLQIDAILQNGVGYTGGSSGTSMRKTGAGTMVLTGTNTYSGITSVETGVLNIRNAQALGQTGASLGSTANGTTVQSGGQLQLQGGISVALETLTLDGGLASNGTLRNVAGNNTWGGYVYLQGDSRINADAGTTLTIANPNGVNASIMNGVAAGKNVTFGGSGDTVLNGGISGFVSNVNKDGAGTLTLAGTNTYAGATSISAGAVKVTNSNGLSGTGVTVSNGAALQFAQDAGGNSISALAVGSTLSGTGLANGGAIQNLSGANSYAGAITLAASSLITANSGTSLTLSGGIGTAAQGLIVGTAANNGNITVSGNVSGGGSLTKDGTGSLTFSGASTTFGTVNMNAGSLTFSGTAVTTGAVHLNAGSILVSSSTTANTGAIDAIAGTTLTIASGGSVVANYAAGTTTFSGALAGSGEFQKDGAGTLVFNNTFTASNLTLTLNGGTLSLLGGQFSFGTIHITGNTVLDFNNSAGTFLSSSNLVIDAGVAVTVKNWTSVANNAVSSTIWYASNTINGATLGGTSQYGGTPLNQIGFTNYNGMTTTWVSGTPNGWFNHEIRPTPEPSTYGLILVAGCVGVIGYRRYRRTSKTAA